MNATDDARKTVLIDEAELSLRFFAYLTHRDGPLPKQPARVVLALVEKVIEERNDKIQSAALTTAYNLTAIAVEWLMDTVNEQSMAQGRGAAAIKISEHEARQ